MEFQDKEKYHEIHPVKLATDISAAALALYLFWQHALISGILVAIVPPVIVSTVIIKWAPLEGYKHSALGRYIDRYMTSAMRLVRLGGMIVMSIGAWYHVVVLIPLGLIVVLLGWLRGILFPVTTSSTQ
ncbi:MAG: hypothetical protein WCE81_03835 [Halobacteriota archaeon]